MKIFITGMPGSGKSAVGKALRAKGYKVIDVDEEKSLTQWVNKNTKDVINEYVGTPEFYDDHDFNWNREILKEFLAKTPDKTVFVCGLTSNQTNDLDLFTKVFLLKADANLLRERMVSRKRVDPTKQDTDVDHVFDWHKSFENEMLKHGAIPINASLPLEEVVLAIEKILDIP